MQRDEVVSSLGLEPTIGWRRCVKCKHVFTHGYWSQDVLKRIWDEGEVTMRGDVTADRFAWARIIEKIMVHSPGPRWLDVGCGLGVGLATAQEYGFEVEGVEGRPDYAALIRACGYPVAQKFFEKFDDVAGFDVVLLAEFLEHQPFPVSSLEQAKRLLRDGGLVYISSPSRDSFVWRFRDAVEADVTSFRVEADRSAKDWEPITVVQWGQVEHYHAFNRSTLEDCMRRAGVEPVAFHVGERYFETIEVIGR